MAWYKLYAGLCGEFGGAKYCGTYEFNSEPQALEAAYNLAVKEYERYADNGTVPDYDQCYQEAYDELVFTDEIDQTDQAQIYEITDRYYADAIDAWIVYYTLNATGPDNKEE